MQAALDMIYTPSRFVVIQSREDPNYADVVNLDRTDLITIRADYDD